MGKPIVRVDMDGVIADLQTPWLRRVNEEYGCNVTCSDITDWDMGKFLPPAAAKDYHKHLHDLSLYSEVEPYPGAREGIEALRKLGYRVVFVTSSTAAGAYGKMNWLKEHGFTPKGEYIPKDFVSAHDKTLVLPNTPLVDDGPHNIAAAGDRGVLFSQPWNQHLIHPWRADTWEDVVNLVPIVTMLEYSY